MRILLWGGCVCTQVFCSMLAALHLMLFKTDAISLNTFFVVEFTLSQVKVIFTQAFLIDPHFKSKTWCNT